MGRQEGVGNGAVHILAERCCFRRLAAWLLLNLFQSNLMPVVWNNGLMVRGTVGDVVGGTGILWRYRWEDVVLVPRSEVEIQGRS